MSADNFGAPSGVLLAALVYRIGGTVKIKQADINKVDGKTIEVVPGNGFVRVKVRGGGK